MFQELREVLRAAEVPMEGEDLLDVLWLAARMPSGAAAPLAGALRGSAVQAPDDGPPPLGLRTGQDRSAAGDAVPGGGNPADAEPRQEPARHVGVISGPTGSAPADALWTPGAKALGSALSLGRALRPLKRRVPSRLRTEFDEGATAALQADTRTPQMVLRPQPERWLRLALVIDGGMSMLLWERQCAELKAIFERSGAFRQVETYQIRYGPGGDVRLGRPWSGDNTATRPANSLADASGQTMVLIVTDGAAAAWRDGRMIPVVAGWARRGPTAVVHTLPRRLWAGSGVRGDTWHVASPRPGAPNTAWTVAHQVLPPAVAPAPAVAVPVLELTPAGFATWAAVNTVVGRPVTMRLWTPRRASDRAVEPLRVSATDFSRAASPEALRLAAHLAAMAPVTVPVMQLVHSCLDQGQGAVPLAEVLLGGLVQPLPPSSGEPLAGRHRLFDFTAEAKDLLLDAVPTAELIDCGRRVGQRIESLGGGSSDFPAWPMGREHPGGAKPFAYLGAALQARLGLSPQQAPDVVVLSPSQPMTPQVRDIDVVLSFVPSELRASFDRVRDAMRRRAVPEHAELLLAHLLLYLHLRVPVAPGARESDVVRDLWQFLTDRGIDAETEVPYEGRGGQGRHDLVVAADGRSYPLEIQRSRSLFFTWPPTPQRLEGPAAFLLVVDESAELTDEPSSYDECVKLLEPRGGGPVIGLRLRTTAPSGLRPAPADRVYVAVEIFGMARLHAAAQLREMETLSTITEAALRTAGVRPDACAIENHGDGVTVLLPPEPDKATVIPAFIDAVDEGLRNIREQGGTTRLRIAMGEDAVRVRRLLDSAVLREEMAAQPQVPYGLIVSEPLHESVPALHGRLRRMRVDLKGYRAWAWSYPVTPGRPEGLPDPNHSNAVLIGASDYWTLPPLAPVRSGLVDLTALLTGPSTGAFTLSRTTALADPGHPGEVLDAVEYAAQSAEDTVLVYFAGHSLLHPATEELSLAVSGTRPASPHTAVAYRDIRYLLSTSRARHKVVILDCCYSGRAMSGSSPSGGRMALASEGTFVLAATASAESAMAPEGERHTAFTGALIKVLEDGVAPGEEIISMDSLYHELRRRLHDQGLPRPQFFSSGTGGAVAIARNPAHIPR
ncbi:SAV_2336 N-terminal domain-related protein [Streptomyces olindensis]|uniref:caspase, EACC1-associated type n=1 Tax=Streptomyces olindensis TaxID=358823 RepID=UPI0036809AFF